MQQLRSNASRFIAAIILFSAIASTPAPAVRAQAPSVRITAVWPESPGTLLPDRSVYARIEYESDRPLRFQARGVNGGVEPAGAKMNPSPVYPSGKGEAIAWIAFRDGVHIDHLAVVVSDDRWKKLDEVTMSSDLTWSAGATPTARPAWISGLNDAQQQAVSQSMAQTYSRQGQAFTPILSLAFLLVPAYPILQILAWRWLAGRARKLALLPLVVMIPVYAFSVFALAAGSNLWPIWIIFVSPPAAIFVGVVLLANRARLQT